MITLQSLFGTGLTRSQKIKNTAWAAVGVGGVSATGDLALIGFQGSKAERGSRLPAILGQGAAMIPGTVLAGFASIGLCLIPGIGPAAAAIIADTLLGYADYRMGAALAKPIRMFTETNKRIRHLEMGGSYIDTEMASRQRIYAIQDMNSAMIPSRRYLGQEALFMHR